MNRGARAAERQKRAAANRVRISIAEFVRDRYIVEGTRGG
jgi:hypothetical protein